MDRCYSLRLWLDAPRSRIAHTHWKWHLDEVYVKINGEMHYLWRAVDHEGEVLASFVTKTRDTAAALKFIRKAMKRHGRPRAPPTACAPTAPR